MLRRLILASTSPRRQELVSQMGIPFLAVSPTADEALSGPPNQVVAELAHRKALSVSSLYPGETVLGADTLVSIGDQVLGKPRDLEEAAAMLRLLSGAWHEVHTGVCLVSPSGRLHQAQAVTQVLFSTLTEEDIRSYCESGEPLGKAGAYAIQGRGGMYIEQIRGSYTNVVGLPTALVRHLLQQINEETGT